MNAVMAYRRGFGKAAKLLPAMVSPAKFRVLRAHWCRRAFTVARTGDQKPVQAAITSEVCVISQSLLHVVVEAS